MLTEQTALVIDPSVVPIRAVQTDRDRCRACPSPDLGMALWVVTLEAADDVADLLPQDACVRVIGKECKRDAVRLEFLHYLTM
jgi:hypothetical protein